MKLLLFLLSIPKTLWVNFRFLRFTDAIQMPIICSYNTSFNVRGCIRIEQLIKFGMIHIGFHRVPVCNSNDRTVIEVNGELIFQGKASLGKGSKVFVSDTGKLILGEDFKISASSAINCYHHISFGANIQFSWDCLVMDSDTHHIFDINNNIINVEEPISFGDDIWIGCRCTILKGSIIPSGCVIGAGSIITGQKFVSNSIIVGNPPSSRKTIGGWTL